jgi:ATP-dependent helicase Lhr and Lhr-like helicase
MGVMPAGPAKRPRPGTPEPENVLARFGPATQAWFSAAFAEPTPAQDGAWRAVSAGRHALVVAPTGSGKTLAAFLWALDRIATAAPPDPALRCRVLYVSPLKALAVDVERNLRSPLAGIRHAAHRLGLPPPQVSVGMRTGDTPAEERRAFARTPTDILITTPESLFLILTSAARDALRGVETVIVDEVHAVAATKRGAHLALSLERLDGLLPRPAQRIGLSATVRPVEEVAQFLGGVAPVEVVQPATPKTIEVAVEVPVEDMTRLDEVEPAGDDDLEPRRPSIWPAVEQRVYDLIRAHQSTIVFANSRRLAERLCARLNELASARLPDPASLHAPAQVMAQSATARGAAAVIARAHHGSVSREERKHIEEALKSGQLPAVVATSSLELGIDMGAVDLVVQIQAPPSVAAGLQRVGRAGHQVGAVSRGIVFPANRGDLLSCAVVAHRMHDGLIEQLHYPRNPLDVLAQHVVAMVAMDPWSVSDLAMVVRRAAPFAELPTSALTATLDMLAGRYPSTAFAELRPRIVWDREADRLTARPGAQHLAVTSGGTIPDRGLFGVFLAGAERVARVGELDEEMVYESRVGDVFLLGSTSWRIEEITPDRVLVSPAPGAPARMPFWKGDQPGRPVELGRAIGATLRDIVRHGRERASTELAGSGLDGFAVANLLSYVEEQRAATRHLPDDRTVLVERFRDELGDWRLAVHCVLGAKVNAGWALAIGARLSERYGVEAQILPSDDGIVVRLPEVMDAEGRDAAPGAELVVFDPEEVAQLVEESVGTSAMFASRFRECAARALLLPRRDPRRRQPLWQQRQRAAQLLDVAREYSDFPITLEAARECLHDVLDVPGLVQLMRELAGRSVRLVEVETQRPSPFARSLLFGYVGAFLYGGDVPLAERRAAALALDSTLLGELLGRVELRELLDPEVIVATERRLQWLDGSRTLRDPEDLVELVRVLGDLSTVECEARGADPAWLDQLARAKRLVEVRIAGQPRWIVTEDAARVRDGLGVALPVGLAGAFLEPVADPIGDLVARYARTHGPFTASACAARFGLGVFVVEQALKRLAAIGRLTTGEFTPLPPLDPETGLSGAGGTEWCDSEVLRLLRRRSLAALRREIEPVAPRALAAFLPRWQQVGSSSRGVAGVAAVLEQLHGVAVPASAWERLVLPARVVDYTPAYLDELCASGELVWAGAGSVPGGDGWIAFGWSESAALLLPPPDPDFAAGELHRAVLDALGGGQALFFRQLADAVGGALGPAVPSGTAGVGGSPGDGRFTGAGGPATAGLPGGRGEADLLAAVWELVWAGLVSNDTLAPVRALLAGGGAHRAPPGPGRSRYRSPTRLPASRLGRASLSTMRSGPPSAAGRWYLLPERDANPTRRATALAEALLDRHGVVTRGAVMAEGNPGGFAAVYPVLAALEERGAARRGYFVDGLGAAQFAVPGAVDRLRANDESPEDGSGARRAPRALVLAATDPANPYGAALPWPERVVDAGEPGAGHRPGRKPGALIITVAGELVLYVERGGRTLLSYVDDTERLALAGRALADAVRTGALGPMSVERADGEAILASPLREALAAAGFRATPRGLRLRA